MCCGLLDNYEPVPHANHLDEDARWITLHILGRGVAIEEGLLVRYELLYEGKIQEVFFTDRVYAKYSESPVMMKQIAKTGLEMLCKPFRTDNEYLKRRLIREYNILVVQDRYGITFMDKSDW